jgi:hypothetical protein
MTDKTEWLIKQTAHDYDMEVSQVRWIYERWYSENLFYEKLEEFIKDRRND